MPMPRRAHAATADRNRPGHPRALLDGPGRGRDRAGHESPRGPCFDDAAPKASSTPASAPPPRRGRPSARPRHHALPAEAGRDRLGRMGGRHDPPRPHPDIGHRSSAPTKHRAVRPRPRGWGGSAALRGSMSTLHSSAGPSKGASTTTNASLSGSRWGRARASPASPGSSGGSVASTLGVPSVPSVARPQPRALPCRWGGSAAPNGNGVPDRGRTHRAAGLRGLREHDQERDPRAGELVRAGTEQDRRITWAATRPLPPRTMRRSVGARSSVGARAASMGSRRTAVVTTTARSISSCGSCPSSAMRTSFSTIDTRMDRPSKG